MEVLFTICLITHIIAGHLALISGLIIFFRKKGDNNHRIIGRIYSISMLGVALPSFYMAIERNSTFLFLINLFVLYQLIVGWLSVKNKLQSMKWYDAVLLLLFFLNGVYMILTLHIVLIGFGGLSIFLTFNELRHFYLIRKQKVKPTAWLQRHIGMIMGSFIGAVTAFLVVNVNFLDPAWLIWFIPTIVFVPLMQFWTIKFTKTRKA